MRLDLRPSKASELIPFQACSLRTLESCEFVNSCCGVSEDGALTWVYKGPVLEVISTATGNRVAALNAEHLLRDEQATVVSVCEFPCQGRARLLVGINGSAEQGMVGLLDVPSSMLIRAVEIPFQVTTVEKVLTYGGTSVPSWAFSEQLRQFNGIVAVGTEGAYVYLLDMALDSTTSIDSSQKVVPSPLLLLEPRERDVEARRQQAATMGQHLALRLGVDEQSHVNDCFYFRRPDLTVVQAFSQDEVQVSSLKYIPQLGTLAIGYSFGGFHLWKLFNPVMEFASSVEPEDLPVAFFVYQEPENDPKNFAYIWVARDDHLSEQKQESLCSVSLYQLSYSRKAFYANYGNFFEELNLVGLRMEHNLTVDPYNSRNTTTWSSQLLSAVTITDPNYQAPHTLTINDSFDDGCQGPDLSLCAFVWEAQDSRPGGSTETFFSVFDMNRWYQAQMPSRIKCVNVGGQEVCPFFAVYRMSEAVNQEDCGALLDIQVKSGSLLRFLNTSPMPPEQHFYPSSLAFDMVCVLSNGIVSASALGVQRQILASMESSGPSCLLKPFDLYHRCLQAGLIARTSDTSNSALSSEEQQRMSLLSLALEQGKIRFIVACIRSWADGDYFQQGCTLKFLLSWAWARVTAIKQQIDMTYRPLFDWSGTPVDQRMLQVLQTCLCCLGHLRTVLHTLLTQSTPVTDQGQVELEHRIKVVTLLQCHLKVILWFIHNGLLPEHEDRGETSPCHFVYPASELSQVFRDRRQQMKHKQGVAGSKEMILIDALVHSAGDPLAQLWKNEEGSGMYPPPSLHGAVSLYLLDSVEEKTKHAIMLYLLFDLACVTQGQQEEFAEKIPKFAWMFDLPLGLVHQIHGFWLIDHMNFADGLTQLRQGSCQDLGSWQHTCILRSLMHHGEEGLALRYLSLRGPPTLTVEDIKMRLNILVANRLVQQAVVYVRTSCGPADQEEMLRFIFLLCQQRKLMEQLFKLPLTEEEEQCLHSYLSESSDSTAGELLVLHLLQRAQYVPAIRLNDRMKHRATMDMSSKARERGKTRNTVVEGFRHALPATQQHLINNPPTISRLSTTRKIDVPRPKPLSTVITQHAERRANSQASLILAVMDKVAEAGKLLSTDEGEEQEETTQQQLPALRKSLGESKHTVEQSFDGTVGSEVSLISQPGPFLCTPTTPKLTARLSTAGQVVFPAVSEKKQTFLSSTLLGSPRSPAANTTIRRSRVFTADCMSLLQTPKIDHTPARVASPVQRSATTPHSILKVSRLQRSSPRGKGKPRSPKVQPKRLGFSTSPTRTLPLPATPTTLSPSSTPSPTTTTPPPLVQATDGASEKEGSAVTPKQIRFAEPETREISPAYVSPDNLSRPPIRSPSEGLSPQQESCVGEANSMSDEEITFNISRQITEPMEAEDESNSSTLPVATPSPAQAPPPSQQVSKSLSPPAIQQEEEKDRSTMSHPYESKELASPRRGLLSGEAPNVQTSFRDRSPISVRTVVEESRSERRSVSPEVSPRASSLVLSAQRETVTQTSILRESKQTSVTSVEHTGQHHVKIVSEEVAKSSTEITVVSEKPQDLAPVIECEDGSQVTPVHSVEAMETVEPEEENIMATVRQTAVVSSRITEELEQPETVEVAADEDVFDLEIKPPTPIRRSTRVTPERTVKSTRTARRAGQRKESASASTDQKESEATLPKLQRLSTRSSQDDWSEEMPPLQLRTEEEDSNDNHPQPSPLPSPSRRSTRRSADPSPPVSPSLRRQSVERSPPPLSLPRRSTRGSVDRSPPVSPSRRSARKSVERSPPPSPSRRSVRQSEERSPPPSPSRRSVRWSEERSPPPSPSTRSVKQSEERSPPPSPSTRSVRRSEERSPPPSPSTRSVRRSEERSPPPSPSTRSVRRSEERSPPPSPSTRSVRRSEERSPPPSPSTRSVRRSEERSPPPSPSTRSVRRSEERSPPPSPSTRSVRRSEERSTSPERSLRVSSSSTAKEVLTVQTESSSDEMMPPPASPTRRSTRLRTPERSPGRKARTPERSTKPQDTTAESTHVEQETKQSQDSPMKEMETSEVVSKSPGRRSRRSKTPDIAKPPMIVQDAPASEEAESSKGKASQQEKELPKSPARRSTRRSQTPEVMTPQPPPSPSRRSRRPSRTPDRSTIASSASHSEKSGDEAPSAAESESSRQSEAAASAPSGRRGTRSSRTMSRESMSSQADSKGAGEGEETSAGSPAPSTRSTRSRSKTPEQSLARSSSRLRGRGSRVESEESSDEVKDISTATEEVRSTRKQRREAASRTPVTMTSIAEETGDAPSFQFAPPTPLSRVQADSTLAPQSDMSAFIFSPPILRSTRSQRSSASSSQSLQITKTTKLDTTVQPETSMEGESEGALESGEPSGAESETVGTKKGRRTTQSRKKAKSKSVSSASPTDSPISLVSPGESTSGATESERGARLPSRRSQSATVTRSRVLRKRKAKLW